MYDSFVWMAYVNYIDFHGWISLHYVSTVNCHELDTVGLNDLSTRNRLGPA